MINPSDPSNTLDLREQSYQEIIDRYGLLAVYIAGLVNLFPDGSVMPDEDFDQAIDFIDERANQLILDPESDGNQWLAGLVGIAYFRGRMEAQNQLKPIAVNDLPFHQTKLRLVEERALGNLAKNVNNMIQNISGELKKFQMSQGELDDLKKNLDELVTKGGINAATRTSRTEIVFASQIANIFQGDITARSTGVEVVYRWQTKEDSRVRDRHAAWNQKLYERSVVLTMLSEPNCRCSIIPVANGTPSSSSNMFIGDSFLNATFTTDF